MADAGPAADVPAKGYKMLWKIGEGTYGIVYKAHRTDIPEGERGSYVAIKRIRIEAADNGVPCSALREVSALKGLKHPNIVELLDVVVKNGVLNLVFEFIEKDLQGYLEPYKGIGLDYGLTKRYLYQLMDGIAYCHSKQMLHRDLKPQNLLVDRGQLKLADFGMARTICVRARPYTNSIVTLWYRPPEILLGDKFYTTSVDLWSIGCIFVEMASGRPFIGGDSEIDQLHRLFWTMGTADEFVWPGISSLPLYRVIVNFPHYAPQDLRKLFPQICSEGISLLQSCLMFHPRHRISASEALQHSLFDDMRPDSQTKREAVS